MTTLKHEELLHKIFTNVNDWLKFAEAKNFGILTLNAAIVFGYTQIEFSNNSILEKVGIAFIPFASLSFIASLISLFPILSKIEKDTYSKKWINYLSNWIDKEMPFENIHFYGYLKDIDGNEFESKFLSKINSNDAFSTYEKELALQILYNSRITWIKYQLFKTAGFFFLLGIPAAALTFLILKTMCFVS